MLVCYGKDITMTELRTRMIEDMQLAEVLEVSVRTVARSWRFARMWLCRELEQGESDVA